MKHKLVIHCCSGIRNSGDEAILQTILYQHVDKCDIWIVSENAEQTQKTVDQFLTWKAVQGQQDIAQEDCKIVVCNNKEEAKTAIQNCDIFLLGGGGLLQDETTIYNVMKWLSLLKLAIKCRKKTIIYANSIGPLKYGINRSAVKRVLEKVDAITLRDDISRKELEGLGLQKQVYVTADPVFSFPYECARSEKMDELDAPYICMTPRHWYDIHPLIPVSICNKFHLRSHKNQERYEAYVEKLADSILAINREYGKRVVILPFLYGRDTRVAEDILARVTAKCAGEQICENAIMRKEVSPAEMMALIGKADMLLGMRLHSIIYAIKMGTPVVPLVYSSKVQGMVELNGLVKYALPIDEVTADALLEKIAMASQEREDLLALERQDLEKMLANEQQNRTCFYELLD